MDLITYALCKKHGGESITYTLTADTENKTIVLTPSEGTAQVITVPYATDASTVNGHEVPELENGKIPANFLPSFVDNVDEYDNISLFPVVGESNRIYIDKSTNKTYRWSGTAYVEISESIALGETSSTAYRGDRGKIAYDHSQSAHAPSNAEANQNAFSNVKIDSDIINASTKTDTLEFIAGDNIILTPNVSNKKITVSQAPVRKTASGNIASFSDGTGDPFLEVKVNIEPVQSGSGDPSPSNVRPISGWSGAQITVTDDLTTPTETHTLSIPFGQTVIGGILNITTGELKPYKYYPSYNGETLVGEWMSSEDKYIAGNTPTTGAQVVDFGAFDTSIWINPTQVTTLLGQNSIFADCGQIEVAYKTPFYSDLTTKNEVQVLINESITSALNASY